MKILLTVTTAAISLGLSTYTVAQAPADNGMHAVREACAADMAKLCPDAKTRQDRHQCMMQNQDKVSDTCKAAVAAMREKMAPATPAPGAR